MTKADRIIEAAALHPDLNSIELARMYGWNDSYVRVVLRQRTGGSLSPADKRYRSRPEYSAKNRAYQRDYYLRKKAEREASHA